MKPKKGLQYLFDHRLLDNTPESRGRLLPRQRRRWTRQQVGDFMGEDVDFNKKVLYAYAGPDETSRTVWPSTMAIRAFVSGFRLPGEAQKIDRMMLEVRGPVPPATTPACFNTADTAYVLAYSVILLNSDQPTTRRSRTA